MQSSCLSFLNAGVRRLCYHTRKTASLSLHTTSACVPPNKTCSLHTSGLPLCARHLLMSLDEDLFFSFFVHTDLYYSYLFKCTDQFMEENMHAKVLKWRSENNSAVSSFLPPCDFQGSNLGCQAWRQAPFSSEPSHWPPSHCFAICVRQLDGGKAMCVANPIQLPKVLLYIKRWKIDIGAGDTAQR